MEENYEFWIFVHIRHLGIERKLNFTSGQSMFDIGKHRTTSVEILAR